MSTSRSRFNGSELVGPQGPPKAKYQRLLKSALLTAGEICLLVVAIVLFFMATLGYAAPPDRGSFADPRPEPVALPRH